MWIRIININFRKKIILQFLVAYVLINIISSISYYVYVKNNNEMLVQKQYELILNQMTNAIDDKMSRMYNLSGILGSNPTLNSALKKRIMSPDAKNFYSEGNVQIREETTLFIQNLLLYDDNIEHIILFDKQEGFLQYTFSGEILLKDREKQIRKQEWFIKTMDKTGIAWLGSNNDLLSEKQKYFAFTKVIKDNLKNKSNGLIYVAYNLDKLKASLESYSQESLMAYYVVDENNKILLSNSDMHFDFIYQNILGQKTSIIELSDQKYIVDYSNLKNNKWKVYGIVNIEYLENSLDRVFGITLVWIIVSSLIFLMVAFLISNKLTKPVREIITGIEKVGKGDFYYNFDGKRKDELGLISTALNRMSSQITDLLKKIKEEENKIKEAEIKALQLQMQPHFIYNTLNAIKFMAMIKNEVAIAEYISALITILKATFSYKKVFISVKEEVDIIKNLEVIMKTRYNNKFDIIYDIDEEIYEDKVFKFMLQPLVENAIVHGIAAKEGFGEIRIKGSIKDQSLFFSVEDDGVGIPNELIDEIMNSRDNKINDMAIINLRDRINMYYGDEYKMIVESEVGKGTRISLSIPREDGNYQSER